MLMIDIYKYIQLNGRASLLDLSRHFRVSESAIEHMLAFWIKKNTVAHLDVTEQNCITEKKCSDCSECDDSSRQIYVYRGNN